LTAGNSYALARTTPAQIIEKEQSMHISIRRYKTDSAPAVTRLVNEQFVSLIDKIPGFLAYYLVDTSEGALAAVSIFETKEGAEESNRVAAGWVKEGLSVLLGRAEITAGEVVVSKTKSD
jgi:hypothetical protein